MSENSRSIRSGCFHFSPKQPYTVPTMETTPETTTPAPKKAYGSVLSILLIVLVLVVGAFYMWDKRVHQQPTYATPDEMAQ